jgi:hypothetical protein
MAASEAQACVPTRWNDWPPLAGRRPVLFAGMSSAWRRGWIAHPYRVAGFAERLATTPTMCSTWKTT